MPPRPLMIHRAGRPEHTPEAELATVATEGEEVVVVLDDGEELRFDRAELEAALHSAEAA